MRVMDFPWQTQILEESLGVSSTLSNEVAVENEDF